MSKFKEKEWYENGKIQMTKVITDKLVEDTGPYHSITGNFDAEKYPGTDLLDTGVELEIPRFCITWKDKEKLMKELAEVIAKYQI